MSCIEVTREAAWERGAGDSYCALQVRSHLIEQAELLRLKRRARKLPDSDKTRYSSDPRTGAVNRETNRVSDSMWTVELVVELHSLELSERH